MGTLTIMSAEANACVQACCDCSRMCLEAAAYCADNGRSAQWRALLDCAAQCQAACECLTRCSDCCSTVCTCCASVCAQCAEICKRSNDKQLQACIDACKRCAECCQSVCRSPVLSDRA